tara:strand:- start:545 stop:745 length:201 start_codon:yes stop_codon:yes gene_type:complete
MKRSNSEILNKVRNVVNEKKPPNTSNNKLSNNKTNETSKFLAQWIEDNAEKITKEIIKEEVKKIFK